MRFKYYIRGFGLGMILTTIVLMVAFHIHGGMTEEQIKKEAQKLGMVDASEKDVNEEKTSQNESLNSGKQEESEQLSQNNPDDEPLDTNHPEESQQPSSEKDTSNPSPITPEPPSEPVYVVIVIENGDSCKVLAQKLYEKNLISDIDDFRAFMQKKDYDNNLHTGTYRIPEGATYEDIAKILIPADKL